MSIYYKFASAKDYDTITFDEGHISLGELKRQIVEQKKLSTKGGADFDLVVTNAQTGEEYKDDSFLVPRNTSVIVKRVPVAKTGGGSKIPGLSSGPTKIATPYTSQPYNANVTYARGPGMTPYGQSAAPASDGSVGPAPVLEVNTQDENEAINSIVNATVTDFMPDRGNAPTRFHPYNRMQEQKTPPPNYICHRCGKPGHFIQHCPTNGDPKFNIKKLRKPTGIPRSFLKVVDGADGSLMMPGGGSAIMQPQEKEFAKALGGITTATPAAASEAILPTLQCPICHNLYNEAVVIPCCGETFCNSCITRVLVEETNFTCPSCNTPGIEIGNLIPNKKVRASVEEYKRAKGKDINRPPSAAPAPAPSPAPVSPAASSVPQAPRQQQQQPIMNEPARQPFVPNAGANDANKSIYAPFTNMQDQQLQPIPTSTPSPRQQQQQQPYSPHKVQDTDHVNGEKHEQQQQQQQHPDGIKGQSIPTFDHAFNEDSNRGANGYGGPRPSPPPEERQVPPYAVRYGGPPMGAPPIRGGRGGGGGGGGGRGGMGPGGGRGGGGRGGWPMDNMGGGFYPGGGPMMGEMDFPPYGGQYSGGEFDGPMPPFGRPPMYGQFPPPFPEDMGYGPEPGYFRGGRGGYRGGRGGGWGGRGGPYMGGRMPMSRDHHQYMMEQQRMDGGGGGFPGDFPPPPHDDDRHHHHHRSDERRRSESPDRKRKHEHISSKDDEDKKKRDRRSRSRSRDRHGGSDEKRRHRSSRSRSRDRSSSHHRSSSSSRSRSEHKDGKDSSSKDDGKRSSSSSSSSNNKERDDKKKDHHSSSSSSSSSSHHRSSSSSSSTSDDKKRRESDDNKDSSRKKSRDEHHHHSSSHSSSSSSNSRSDGSKDDSSSRKDRDRESSSRHSSSSSSSRR